MRKDFSLDSNDAANGYTYRYLSTRIDTLERKYDHLEALLTTKANELNISLEEAASILNALDQRVSYSAFEHHVNDTDIHSYSNIYINNVVFMLLNKTQLDEMTENGGVIIIDNEEDKDNAKTQYVYVNRLERKLDLYKLDYSKLTNGDIYYIKENDSYYVAVRTYIEVREPTWNSVK